MSKIKDIKAIEILDSRGNPTLEVSVLLNDDITGSASCPSGASIGTYEAVELRDHDQNRYQGMGVLKAIENIQTTIAPKLIGMDPTHQQEIDQLMISLDGTQNKGRLGANTILSVSMAVCRAAANSSVLPLFLYLRQFIKHDKNIPPKIPTPLFNVLNGGKHAGDNIDFQEFLAIPASGKTFQESLEIGTTVYHALKTLLGQRGLVALVGDEGGFGPKLASNTDALVLLKTAIESTRFIFDRDVFIGIDVAANSFYHNQQYRIKDKQSGLSGKDLIAFYQELQKTYHFLYLEDPLAEDDWDNWKLITEKLQQETLIVGDDLVVTNPYRLQMALDKKAITAMIIKPNQIGTVMETLAVTEVAKEAGIKIIVSHRSGETIDDFVADLAVAVSADYVKFGAPARGERVAKYNRLAKIDAQLKIL